MTDAAPKQAAASTNKIPPRTMVSAPALALAAMTAARNEAPSAESSSEVAFASYPRRTCWRSPTCWVSPASTATG